MTTQLPPAGWYPDPTGKPGQMYWDGQGWHEVGPPTTRPARKDLLAGLVSLAKKDLLAGLPIGLRWAIAGLLIVVGVAIFLHVKNHQGSSPSPTQSAPGAPLNAAETKFVNDYAAVGDLSTVADPKEEVAVGWKICQMLASGTRQDDVAYGLVSNGSGFDQSSADQAVQISMRDLCPQQLSRGW
jgi:hypothetical protein